MTKERYFDGKYAITDARERIAARRDLAVEGRPVYHRTGDELAHYSILDASPVSAGNEIVCPNCGNATTREDLLDGCDLCGTRFAVEDLGPRVSSFALRRDYEIAYDKFRDARRYYGNRAFLAAALPTAVLSLIASAAVAPDVGAGIVMSIVAAFFCTGFLALSAGFFARYLFWISIFPFIQAKQSFAYHTGKKLAQQKAARSWTASVEREIRSFDPLFSRESFFSNVQNKLAAIHYAEKAEEVRPFASIPLDRQLAAYRDVVDMDAADMSLLSFRTDGTSQYVELRAELILTVARGARFSQRAETVRLSLEKSASCRTEAVCGPSILRCRSCGSSLSLLDGGRCAYCGTELDLRAYAWAIAGYAVE